MLGWRRSCQLLLLLACGVWAAEMAEQEDATCQLEIQKRPKAKATAKAHGKAKKKRLELLKVEAEGLSKKSRAKRAKGKRAKAHHRLPEDPMTSESDEEPDEEEPETELVGSGDTDADETNADATDFEVVDVDAKKSHGPTFAVTTRVYSAELPYLKHFLKYYLENLKVKRVYLFCTKSSEESSILKAVRSFGFSDKQVTFVRGKRNASLQRLNYHAVQEDFLLDVDCDEFLVPPKGGLHGVVKKDPHADGFHLRWTCYPSDAEKRQIQPKGIPCTGLKGMIRTKSLHDRKGHYKFVEGTPVCGGKGHCVFSKHVIPLAHIQYRGFWDSVLKDVSSPAGSQWMLKGQPKGVALKKIRKGQPAKRMQSLAFEMVCVERFGAQLLSHQRLRVPGHMSFSIDSKLQARALRKAGFDRVLKMQADKSYRRYKEALHMSFDRLLCNPKKTCNDVKPHHVSKLLEKMTSEKLRSYNGRCQKPESGSHKMKFTLSKSGKFMQKGDKTGEGESEAETFLAEDPEE